jgi:hypothetical protein
MVRMSRRAVLAVAAAFSGACNPARSEPDPREAIRAAHDFVKERLVSSGTAVFGGEADTQVEQLSPGKFRVTGMVDYGGAEGTMRVSFTCVVSDTEDNGRWSLEEMDFNR